MTPPARRQERGSAVRLRGTSVFRGNRYHDATWAATGFSGGSRAGRGEARPPSPPPTTPARLASGRRVATLTRRGSSDLDPDALGCGPGVAGGFARGPRSPARLRRIVAAVARG